MVKHLLPTRVAPTPLQLKAMLLSMAQKTAPQKTAPRDFKKNSPHKKLTLKIFGTAILEPKNHPKLKSRFHHLNQQNLHV